MAIHKLAPNIPLTINAKYCDVVPGQYGPQVRLKGVVDGEDGLVFLPGKVWASLKALRSAGAIGYDDVNEEPTDKPVEVPLLAHDLTLTSKKGAGDKYATLEVVAGIQKANGKPPITSALPKNAPKHVPGDDADDKAYADRLAELDGDDSMPALEALFAKHEECIDAAIHRMAPKIEKYLGTKCPPDVIAAIAATAFIARTKEGV